MTEETVHPVANETGTVPFIAQSSTLGTFSLFLGEPAFFDRSVRKLVKLGDTVLQMGMHHQREAERIAFFIEHAQMGLAESLFIGRAADIFLHIGRAQHKADAVGLKLLQHRAERTFGTGLHAVHYGYGIDLFFHSRVLLIVFSYYIESGRICP